MRIVEEYISDTGSSSLLAAKYKLSNADILHRWIELYNAKNTSGVGKKLWTISASKMKAALRLTDNHYLAKTKVNLVRYADDFIITANSKQTAEELKLAINDYIRFYIEERPQDRFHCKTPREV